MTAREITAQGIRNMEGIRDAGFSSDDVTIWFQLDLGIGFAFGTRKNMWLNVN